MHKLHFDERLGILVDAQWLWRENKRLDRTLKEAKLKLSQACIEDVDFAARRELDKAVIRQLGRPDLASGAGWSSTTLRW